MTPQSAAATPFFSIILPVYNGQAYVAQAIQSVLAQTESDWELIIVDDCSVDATPGILSHFKDDRIHVLRNKQNLHIARSQNLGTRFAKGKWIVHIDADDFFNPDYLKILRPYAMDGLHRNTFVSGWVTSVDEHGAKIVDVRLPKVDTIRRMMRIENFLYHPATSFSKALWEKVDGYPEKDRTIAEDTGLWIKFFDAKAELVMIKQFLVNYRIHYSNITSINDAKLSEAGEGMELKAIRQNREWRISLYLKQNMQIKARSEIIKLGRIQNYLSFKNLQYFLLTFLPQRFVYFYMWEIRPRLRAAFKSLRGRSERV